MIGVEVGEEDLAQVGEADRAPGAGAGCPRRSRTGSGRPRGAPAPRAGRGARSARSRRCRRRRARGPWRAESCQPEISPARKPRRSVGGHVRDPHRVLRRTAALGGAPGVEDLKAVGARSCNGICEWPKITASAWGNRRRIRASRLTVGPASCTTMIRRPASVTSAVVGSEARTAASSTLPATATTATPRDFRSARTGSVDRSPAWMIRSAVRSRSRTRPGAAERHAACECRR